MQEPLSLFSRTVLLTAAGNKSTHLCMLKAKAVYTGLYAYSNEFVEALALEKWHTAILRMFSTEIEVE